VGEDYGVLSDLLDGALKIGKMIHPILRTVSDVASPILEAIVDTFVEPDENKVVQDPNSVNFYNYG
jgi:hypothetical protein